MAERVYLDYAATAPLRPEARTAVLNALETFGNPSSVHAEGQAARFLLDSSRRDIADVLAVRAERIVFTSGGTEANNLALRGYHAGAGGILCSAIEHDCVLATVDVLGGSVVPVNPDGMIDLAALQSLLKKGNFRLVSIMHANNETGVLQPIEEIARIVHSAGAVLHVDAVQTVGHIPVDVDMLGADLLGFSAHKFGGPKGAGALIVKPELTMRSLLTGGSQERNRRAGTESLPALAGMSAALTAAARNMPDERTAAESMGAFLAASLPAGLEIVAPASPKVPHMLQLRTPGRHSEDIIIALDIQGIAASQGSACSSGRVQASHVLKAMGFDDIAAGEGLRLSWGWASAPGDIHAALTALRTILR